VKLGHWAVNQREEGQWYVLELGDEPGSGWRVLREWPLGFINVPRNALPASLKAAFPPAVPTAVAEQLVAMVTAIP
jgi:hypothetical protein